MVAHGGQYGVKIDVSKALDRLARMGATLAVRETLEAIGQNELRWTGLNLQKAGRVPDGSPWAKMAPLTLRLRPLRVDAYHFSSPYQALLQQSMTVRVDAGAGSVSIGTNARYAVEHHEGRPERNLPARKLVGSPAGARARAMQLVSAIVAKVRKDNA